MLSFGRERKLTMLSERITKIITFLQADTPIEDIAKKSGRKASAQYQQDRS